MKTDRQGSTMNPALPPGPVPTRRMLRMSVLATVLFCGLGHVAPVQAKGMNRLTKFKVTGEATLTVTIAVKGQPQLRPVLRVPSARMELQCRRSGYRPNRLIYGPAPLTHAVKLGRARAQSFRSARLRQATKTAVFPAFSLRERGPKNRRILAKLEGAAWLRCAKNQGPATRKLTVAVAARCKRVKGFGARWATMGAKAVVPVRIVCHQGTAKSGPPVKRAKRIGRPGRR